MQNNNQMGCFSKAWCIYRETYSKQILGDSSPGPLLSSLPLNPTGGIHPQTPCHILPNVRHKSPP